MFIVFIKPQFFHDLFGFLIGELRDFNPLLFNLLFDAFKHIIGYTCRLLRLELGEDFAEMVDALIRVKTRLFRRFLVGWFFIIDEKYDLFCTLITHHNTFTLNRYHLASVTKLAYIGGVDIFRNIHIRLIDTRQVFFNIIVLIFEEFFCFFGFWKIEKRI